MVTPNSVLTDNINGTFITYNGNEFCLQNDRGNVSKASITEGYVPIGAKEYNGVIYIISVKDSLTEDGKLNPDESLTQIGCYPGLGAGNKLDPDKYTVLDRFYTKEKENEKVIRKTEAKLRYTTQTPVTIEVQPSYDGSVNLIIVADGLPVRMINSGFSVLPNAKYKLIEDRNQTEPTNLYNLDYLDEQVSLVLNNYKITNVKLLGVQSGGQFKGGNYTFYIKFGDADYNQTDVVAESGIVSIFNGNDAVPYTISGTLLDERTDKMVHLNIEGLNHTYSKIYIYYSREYSDTQGYRMTEYGVFSDPINMNGFGDAQDIWLSGYEQTETIDSEVINVDYHTIDWARAEAQQANMLFLGNVGQTETYELYKKLKDRSLEIETRIEQSDELEGVSFYYNHDKECSDNNAEYYSTKNIHEKLGYWPNEWYRFGVVYVLKDGSTTPVFNMKGNVEDNEYGVFKTPDVAIFSENKIKPLHFQFTMTSSINDIPEVIGYFYVRQKRIPMTLCQGIRIGIDKRSHLPITWNGKRWFTQSFLALSRWQLLKAYTTSEKGRVDRVKVGDDKYDLYVENKLNEDKSHALDAMPTLEYYSSKILEDSNSTLSGSPNLAKYVYVQIGLFSINGETSWAGKQAWETALNDLKESDPIALNNYIVTEGSISTMPEENTSDVYAILLSQKYIWNEEGDAFITPDLQGKYIIYPSTSSNFTLCDFYTGISELGNIFWGGNESETLKRATNHNNQQINWYKNDSASKNIEAQIPFERKYIVYPESKKTGGDPEGGYGILSLDPFVNATVRSVLDGSEFTIKKEYSTKTKFGTEHILSSYEDLRGEEVNDNLLQVWEEVGTKSEKSGVDKQAIYIPPNTKMKEITGIGFSNVAGEAIDASQYSYAYYAVGVRGSNVGDRGGKRNNGILYRNGVLDSEYNAYDLESEDSDTAMETFGFNCYANINILRGIFTPYVGTTAELKEHGVYSIRVKEPGKPESLKVRQQDSSPYFAVSERYDKTKQSLEQNVYRGDCFTSTVSMRILRNHIDPTVPVSDNILDYEGWEKHVRLRADKERKDVDKNDLDWNKLNLADVNTVDLGYWVSFKCLSSYNLGLRAEDTFNTDELALIGSPRSFFPLNSGSTATGNKLDESGLLNDGYSATVGEKRYNLLPDTPYSKSEFANRIMFSNVHVTDAFTNGYRTFQGISYHDYDKQYGAITKLVSFGTNLLVVMEHGIGLVGVNEQALMQTTTGEAIHIYGHGVLSDTMQIISQDFGSKYEHSVIRTPIGVYGMDTDARKIWRFSNNNGFETLSDMKIESYLNDNLFTDKKVDVSLVDVRAHYNAAKGDVMFTFYHQGEENVPDTTEPEEKKYISFNRSAISMYMNSEVSKTFSTNLSEDEIEVSSLNGLVSVEIDYEGKRIILKSSKSYGTDTVSINGQTIQITVKSEAERQQEIQQQISDETNSTTDKYVDEETGEEKVVVKSKLKISLYGGNYDLKVGKTTTILVNFQNNANNITIADCDIKLNGKNAFTSDVAKVTVSGANRIHITPLKTGEYSYSISYGDTSCTGRWTFEELNFELFNGSNPEAGPITEITVFLGENEVVSYKDNADKVTIDGKSKVQNEFVSATENDGIYLIGLKVGDSTFSISDGNKTIPLTVHVVEPVKVTDIHVYDGTEEILDKNDYADVTVRVGETVKYRFTLAPENYTKSRTRVTYSAHSKFASIFGLGLTMGDASGYITITGKSAGTGLSYLRIYNNNVLGASATINVTVTE